MIALIAVAALQGQAADSVALRHAHGQPPPTVSAVGVTRAPLLDGRLDDPAWAVAVSISELIQQDPHEGTPVSEPRSLKVNAVLCWEYRPGSTMYVAWTQSRSGYFTGDGSFDLGRDLGRDLFVDRPANVLLVKVTYWISR